MDKSDDGKKVGVADPGSIPGTSTNSLVGSNVHGVKPPSWYYTPNEWSRSIGWGQVPPERNSELLTNEYGGETDFDGANEILQEDKSTSQ